MAELFDKAGKKHLLGKKLGSGGEGAVYEVPSAGNDVVAKVYHRPIGSEKQNKLLGMVGGCDDSLKKIAAWPIATLHQSSGGAVRGFLMPKVVGYEPVHHLYGPSHRKQSFPNADWAFLVNAARNVAAAFEAIHVHRHVIGDVNPNVVFVAANSIVKLIDCDSFQITCNGKNYLCEVGVAHFTPPELLHHSTFGNVQRTKNHDGFGLALLIFHLLLMGRHPYSGVYAGSSDMPLEKAIAQFRYAFGNNTNGKGMSPPPNSVTPAILPPAIAQYFERAFSETGAQAAGRPTAREWLGALDSLKASLRTCGQESLHKYYGGLPACPWCAQEKLSGAYFFINLLSTTIGAGAFNLNQVWARISAIQSPGSAPSIDTSAIHVQPKPIPAEIASGRTTSLVKKITAIVGMLLGLAIAPKGFLVYLIVGSFLFFSNVNDSAERRKRKDAQQIARKAKDSMALRWRIEAGDQLFQTALNQLSLRRAEYESLNGELSKERQKLQQNLRNGQMQKYLEKFFIEKASISGVGPTRKAVLASFGIETAADVEKRKILNVKDFGDKLTADLVDWRRGIEQRFVFDPSKGVDPTDIAALNQRFAQKRREIEGALLAGPENLTQSKSQILRTRETLRNAVLDAARELAQTEADLSVLG